LNLRFAIFFAKFFGVTEHCLVPAAAFQIQHRFRFGKATLRAAGQGDIGA
jgi:hypothetical protein